MFLIKPSFSGVHEHLAAEEILLNGAGPGVPALMIWRGPRAVVLGKNQNPWKECNVEVIRDRNLLLTRRVSGGGSVYHDPGNLNFSWILDRSGYRPETLHAVLRGALARFGLNAHTAATGGLMVQGCKVSGAAYCYRQDRVLHHGTLLWDADLDTLRAALSAPRIRLQTHAVKSVPARVANLREWLPERELDEVAEALIAEAETVFGPRRVAVLDPERLGEALPRLRSAEWILGQTPRFRVELCLESAPLILEIHRGRVSAVTWRGHPHPLPEEPEFGIPMFPVLEALTQHGSGDLRRVFHHEGWRWWTPNFGRVQSCRTGEMGVGSEE